MTARLGFVGVGRHAQKMAAAFRECGAEVVAHARRDGWASTFEQNIARQRPEGFGSRMPWSDQITSPNIDALIICAPPEVTTEVALACAKAGKRCVATKPLMVSSIESIWSKRWLESDRSSTRPETRVFVDLWRLYSPAWQALKAELRGKQIQSVHVDFYGNGPARSFSGALDYGPHALAFVADLLGELDGLSCGTNGPGLWEIFRRPERDKAGVVITTGNGAKGPKQCVSVTAGNAFCRWVEVCADDDGVPPMSHVFRCDGPNSGRPLMVHDRSLALRSFCRAFLSGEPSDTLRISCEAMKVLMPLVT